jgi:hypothetical protein
MSKLVNTSVSPPTRSAIERTKRSSWTLVALAPRLSA